jgi:hypothetical protein
MIPMRHSTIFRSRWFALVWAAGIIWFALDTAGTPSDDGAGNNVVATDATGAPVDDQQLKQLESVINGL